MTSSPAPAASAAKQFLVYIGTYTGPESKGIYVSRFDADSGKLSPAELAAEAVKPSFVAVHPNRRFLYAVGEVAKFSRKKSGAVSALAIDRSTGQLTLLNQAPSGGPGPCHLVVDQTGENLLVANYSGGSVAVLRIGHDGRLGAQTAFVQHAGSSVHPRRQRGPHAHSINLGPGNQFAFAADLGLDKVLVYRFDAAAGTLAACDPAAVKPGAGPRHFAFHPSGKFAYVINELDSTVTVFAYDSAAGALSVVQTVPALPQGFDGVSWTAEVQVHPSGKFVYGSNRGHDSIVVYAVDGDKGTLALVEHEPTQGQTPRHFGIDPSGRYLLAANQKSDSIVVFRIDAETGQLTPTGQVIAAPSPVCVKFLPVD